MSDLHVLRFPEPTPANAARIAAGHCSVVDCLRPIRVKSRRLCHMHHLRWLKSQWRAGTRVAPLRPDPLEALLKWVEADPNGGCWLWGGALNKHGYGKAPGRNTAHRAMWRAVNGPITGGLWVLHHCDVRACINPAHLYLGTPQDNGRDKRTRGRAVRGEHHCWAKLTQQEAEAVRSAVAAGRSRKACAREHGVTPRVIRLIVNNLSYVA